jgi:HAD superfamily hydrolase (TIGR01549 family)
MDGVLVDSEPIHQENERVLFEELGLQVSAEEHNSYVGMSAMDVWKLLIQRHKLNKTPEELLSMGRNRYLEMLRSGNHVQLVDGSVELVDYFLEHKLNVLLASSASRRTILAVLDHFNILDRFSVIASGTDVEFSKPNPAIFLQAAAGIKAKPECCLVIEDSTNGVRAALAADMFCVGFQNRSAMSQDLSSAHAVVDHLNEIDMALLSSLENVSGKNH